MDFYHRLLKKNYVFGCNLCSLSCPNNVELVRYKPLEAYACWSLDEDERKSSSSGGIASIFYAYFIQKKQGVIYGCSYQNNLQLHFSRGISLEDISKFKTSKYSFSFIGNTFQKIKEDLLQNRNVIFIGAPCQVAGLRQFLKQDYPNLLCIDFICHGMPPQQYLDDYISSLNLPEIPDNLTFRGIHNHYFTLYTQEKIIYQKSAKQDYFYRAFYEGLIHRDCCYHCQYSNPYRTGDLTIGDFWGLGKKEPFCYDTQNGVSLVLINNHKGELYFKEIQDKLFFKKRTIDEAIKGNQQLNHPVMLHPKHQKFLELYQKSGIQYAFTKIFKEDF